MKACFNLTWYLCWTFRENGKSFRIIPKWTYLSWKKNAFYYLFLVNSGNLSLIKFCATVLGKIGALKSTQLFLELKWFYFFVTVYQLLNIPFALPSMFSPSQICSWTLDNIVFWLWLNECNYFPGWQTFFKIRNWTETVYLSHGTCYGLSALSKSVHNAEFDFSNPTERQVKKALPLFV